MWCENNSWNRAKSGERCELNFEFKNKYISNDRRIFKCRNCALKQ
jgi:hypothetical protein